jgi:hypothetical protein
LIGNISYLVSKDKKIDLTHDIDNFPLENLYKTSLKEAIEDLKNQKVPLNLVALCGS